MRDDGVKFWMVWNTDYKSLMVKHSSYELAKAEAERLAAFIPGKDFFVLEAVSVTYKTTTITRKL